MGSVEIEEFSEFFETATNVVNTFGLGAASGSVPIVRDMYLDSYGASVLGQPSTLFVASEWGVNESNLPHLAEEHIGQVLQDNLTFIPDPNKPNEIPSGYIPPDKTKVDEALQKFTRTFPLLAMAIEKINIFNSKEGGSSAGGELNLPTPINNLEMLYFVTTHESTHSMHTNYQALNDVVSLGTLNKIACVTIKNAGLVAADFANLPGDEASLRAYGLYIDVFRTPYSDQDRAVYQIFRDNLDNSIDRLGVRSLLPQDSEPLASDDQDMVNTKLNTRMNWLMHHVARSMLNNTDRFDTTSDTLSARNWVVAQLFDEIEHYLVGPFQDKNHGGMLLHSYDNLETRGILGRNLEHQKEMMKLLAREDLNGDPRKIRESLGLPIQPDEIEKFGGQIIGEVERGGSKFKIYKLPSDTETAYYYVQNLNNSVDHGTKWIEYPANYAPLTTEEVVDLYSGLSVNGAYSVARVVETDAVTIAEANIGRVDSDKITYEFGLRKNENSFVWAKIDDKIHLYEAKNGETPTEALLFGVQGNDDFYRYNQIVAKGPTGFTTLKEFLPQVGKGNTEMRIVDVRTQGKVTIGDVTDWANGTYELDITDSAHTALMAVLKDNPNLIPTIRFDVQNNDLLVYLEAYNPNTDITAVIEVKKMTRIKDGYNMW
jgi:hypothetical protein